MSGLSPLSDEIVFGEMSWSQTTDTCKLVTCRRIIHHALRRLPGTFELRKTLLWTVGDGGRMQEGLCCHLRSRSILLEVSVLCSEGI